MQYELTKDISDINSFDRLNKLLDLELETLVSVEDNGILKSSTSLGKNIVSTLTGILDYSSVVIRDKLSNLKDIITSNNDTDVDKMVSTFLRNRSFILRRAKEIDYFKARNIRFNVPVGLKKPLIDMGTLLEKYGKTTQPDILEELVSFDKMLGTIISSKKTLSMKDITDSIKSSQKKRTVVIKDLSKVLDKNSANDTLPLSDLIGNINEFVTIIDNSKKVNELFSPVIMDNIRLELTSIDDKLKIIIDMLVNNKLTNIPKPMVKNLAKAIGAAAEMADLASTTYYIYIQYIKTINDMYVWMKD